MLHYFFNEILHHELCGVNTLVNTKAASCFNTRNSSSISGPWSFDWIKDHHVGDAGVVFSHKKKRIR
jgi:hypothetical protein